MKKPKKIDQHLLDLETTMNFTLKIMIKEKFSDESMDLYNRARNNYCNEIQRRKDLRQSFRPVINEYKIIK